MDDMQASTVEGQEVSLEELSARRAALDALLERERRLRERARELAAREAELAASRQELFQHMRGITEEIAAIAGSEGALAGEAERLRAGTIELAERESAIREAESLLEAESKRLAGLDRKAAELTELERELERRSEHVAARELLVGRLEPRADAPPPPPVRTYNIESLQSLVAAGGEGFAGRLEEWEAFLFELRPHAAPDGLLPASFTGLIEEVFGPLV